MRIMILGIGGVGGYFGGRLAATYPGNEHEIIFLARGKHAEAIHRSGLKVYSTKGDFTAFPSMVTDDPAKAGIADVFICAVKTYDLESSLDAYASCIGKNTLVIPLANGIDGAEKIRARFPHATVCDGCTYLVSRLAEPGVIRETGKIDMFFFGTGNLDEKTVELLRLFRATKVEAYAPPNIREITWEKFLFISSIATLTCFYDCSVGEVLGSAERKEFLLSLLSELKLVAFSAGVPLAENSIPKILERMSSLPHEATSSMHTDMKKGARMEIDSLTKHVIALAGLHNIAVPGYEKALEGILSRTGSKSTG
jgi:2-dehydropantoate 2-reductase